jgi:hypothetical protein
VRVANQQSIAAGLTQRIAALAAGLAELSDYVARMTRDSEPDCRVAAIEDDSSAKPIEFLTENGFAIVRPWEADGSPAPTEGVFHFIVRDPHNAECEVTVEVAHELFAETALHTRGRIQASNSFWICCAERHLSEYITEHDGCPDGNRLSVESLDCAEVMLALRWGQKPARQQGQPSVTGPP